MNVTEVRIKESRKPCCGKGWPQRDSAEHEGYAGALTDKKITENNNINVDSRNCNGINLGTAWYGTVG